MKLLLITASTSFPFVYTYGFRQLVKAGRDRDPASCFCTGAKSNWLSFDGRWIH
jgi:hypothetical protein